MSMCLHSNNSFANRGMRVFTCFIFIFLLAVSAFAQQPPSAEDIVAKMQAKLKLTQDQVSAVTPIVEKFAAKREELRQGVEDGTIERNDMRAQMKQMRIDEGQELSQILSVKQMAQWKAMLNEMRRHPPEAGSALPSPAGEAPKHGGN